MSSLYRQMYVVVVQVPTSYERVRVHTNIDLFVNKQSMHWNTSVTSLNSVTNENHCTALKSYMSSKAD